MREKEATKSNQHSQEGFKKGHSTSLESEKGDCHLDTGSRNRVRFSKVGVNTI